MTEGVRSMRLYKYIGGKAENRIEKEIRQIKQKIYDLVENKNKNIIDSEVIKLSKKLDDLLIYYIGTSKKAS